MKKQGPTATPSAAPARRQRSPAAAPPAIRRLPLGSLRVFVAVADQLSFTRAAAALGVTTSAASMQIQALEEYLRIALFRRDGRQVLLTTEGAQLLPKVRQGLGELERALDGARAERGAGPLRITTMSSFLSQWIMPRLPEFSRLNPRVDLQIDTSPEVVDFVRSGVHAGLRFGAGEWAHLHVEKLFDEWLIPVCKPSLLKKHGPVNDAKDLERYRLMHSTSEPWSAWLFEKGESARWPACGIAFDDSLAIIRATEAGQGLALARWSLVAGEIAEGRLVLASSRALKFARSYYFVCPPSLLRLEKVEVFRKWVLEEAGKFAPPSMAAVA